MTGAIELRRRSLTSAERRSASSSALLSGGAAAAAADSIMGLPGGVPPDAGDPPLPALDCDETLLVRDSPKPRSLGTAAAAAPRGDTAGTGAAVDSVAVGTSEARVASMAERGD